MEQDDNVWGVSADMWSDLIDKYLNSPVRKELLEHTEKLNELLEELKRL